MWLHTCTVVAPSGSVSIENAEASRIAIPRSTVLEWGLRSLVGACLEGATAGRRAATLRDYGFDPHRLQKVKIWKDADDKNDNGMQSTVCVKFCSCLMLALIMLVCLPIYLGCKQGYTRFVKNSVVAPSSDKGP